MHPPSILPALPDGFGFILAFVVRWGLALSAMISSDIETMEGVPTTKSQLETSRRNQCKSVSKKSGGLNLSLYHLE